MKKDLIYTRSNIRHEQVYLFPITMPQTERKALFIEYLHKADELRAEAKWYNTLTSNCTTLVFDRRSKRSTHKLYLKIIVYWLQAIYPIIFLIYKHLIKIIV